MSLGTYTLSDISVWTGPEVRDEIARFSREVTSLNNDVNTHRNALIASGAQGSQFWTDWQVFLREWNAWAARDHAVLWGASFTGPISELRRFVDRFNPLESRYRSTTGIVPSSSSADSRPPSWWSSVQSAATSGPGLMVAAGIGVVGLVAIAVIATQARTMLAPVRRNPRRRKRRSR